ncbi:MAG: GTP 3',8-cyclase MoaA [Chloroflexi bacterium]|nr:GTP 3',8-cyclase MoaA [Chloroflexota bacterium]
MTGLSDSFNRPIDYLRLSITDRCNLRCVYCMPAEGIELSDREDVLSFDEIIRLVAAAASMGITKVRITGGEPLVRTGVVDLVGMLATIEGIDDLCLTTNGLLLGQYARELKAAGLRRVNVSLDSLRPERFEAITRWGKLDRVLEGINLAHEVGLVPVKINVVVLRGINDDEIVDFGRKTLEDDWNVRFIELMPFGEQQVGQDRLVTVSEIRERLSPLGPLEACSPVAGGGPARYYRFPGARGTVGFISPVTEHFCFSCNRLRLTATGMLRPCLLQEQEVNLREPLRAGASREELAEMFKNAALCKPEGHKLDQGLVPRKRSMTEVGG